MNDAHEFDPGKPVSAKNFPFPNQIKLTDDWPMPEHLEAIMGAWIAIAMHVPGEEERKPGSEGSFFHGLFDIAKFNVEGGDNFIPRHTRRPYQAYQFSNITVILNRHYEIGTKGINLVGNYECLRVYLNLSGRIDDGTLDTFSGTRVAQLIWGNKYFMMGEYRTEYLEEDAFVEAHKKKYSWIIPGDWYNEAKAHIELTHELKDIQIQTVAIAERNETLREWGLLENKE